VERHSQKMADENHKKLAFVVVYLLLFVFAIFGFAPLI